MRAKITALLCALTLIFTALPVFAGHLSEDNLQEAMGQIGILNWSDASKITKKSFVYSLAGFIYDDVKSIATAEEIAVEMGLIEEGETFNENERITTEEAVKYAMIVMGYSEAVNSDNYMNAASNVGILSGVSMGSKLLQNDDGLKIIENMMDAYPLVKSFEQGRIVYKSQTEKTMLMLYRDIYKVEGIFSATDKTSIYGDNKAKAGMIRIGNNEYEYSGKTDALGSEVVAYVKGKIGDEGEVLYIGNTRRNEYLTIDAENIIKVEDDISGIKYEKDTMQYDTAKLSPVLKVIYNGKFFGNYTKNDLMPDVGSIKLIDNDNDDVYDIAFITKYETMVVSSVDTDDREITNKYTYIGSVSSIKIEDDDTYVIYKDGIEVEIESISEGDVLSIAQSHGVDGRIITIYASSKRIDGTMEGKNDEEDTICIDDMYYSTSKAFHDYLTKEGKSLKIGTEYVFYIDAFGNIAYFKNNSVQDYVLTLKFKERNDSYVMVYMDLNGEWNETSLARKVDVDGTVMSKEAAYSTLSAAWEPQIVIMKQNYSGEINGIDTAEDNTSNTYMEDRFNKFTKSYTYRIQTNSFSHSLYLQQGAKLVVFPSPLTTNKSDYFVAEAESWFSEDETKTLTVYDVDEFNTTPLISISGEKGGLSSSLFIITSVSQICDRNGDIHTQIKGNVGNFRNYVLVSDKENFVDKNNNVISLASGDVVKVCVNNKGYVDYAEKQFSLKDPFVPSGKIEHNRGRASGVIDAIDFEKEMMRVAGIENMYIRLLTSLPVQVYSIEDKTCELKTVEALKKGDKIYISYSIGAPTSIIVLDD